MGALACGCGIAKSDERKTNIERFVKGWIDAQRNLVQLRGSEPPFLESNYVTACAAADELINILDTLSPPPSQFMKDHGAQVIELIHEVYLKKRFEADELKI